MYTERCASVLRSVQVIAAQDQIPIKSFNFSSVKIITCT